MTTRRLMRLTGKLLLSAGSMLLLIACARAQEPGQSSAPPAVTRACSANPVLAPSGKPKHAAKTKNPLPAEPLPACVEIKGDPLEIQEALQTIARELQWRIHDNHATEDSWTFVRYLDTEELEKYADTKVLIQPVDFEDGKAAVVVRTTDIGEGFVRVQVSAHFEGDGKSSDTTMKHPATSWELKTKGVLEQEMVVALRLRARS
jgi:hypothetical protein